jgi:hypothetical protein
MRSQTKTRSARDLELACTHLPSPCDARVIIMTVASPQSCACLSDFI